MSAWWNGMLMALGFRQSEAEKAADKAAEQYFIDRERERQEREERVRSLQYAVYKDGERVAVGKRYSEKDGVLTLVHDNYTHSIFARHAWDMVIQEER